MILTKENLERTVHSMLVEWGWERGWADQQKQAWVKQFTDIVKQKNPEVINDPGFQNAMDFLHKQGISAADAADKMTLQPAEGPMSGELPLSRQRNQYL